MSYDYTIKIMVLGDESVEKTSLINRYISGSFLDDLRLTTGVDFCSKTLSLDDKKIKLQIWDFGGEERFRFLLHQYCKGAQGGLFVFNTADSSSIDHIDEWLSAIRKGVGTKVSFPILVVGLLPDDDNLRKVSAEEGVNLAKSRNLNGYIECNPKTGENVGEVFEALTRLILADNSKSRKKRELKNTNRSQLLEKISNKGAMDKPLDAFQIPEEENKDEQPRLSGEDIRILDLESEEGVKLTKQYQEETNRTALWKGKETIDFVRWLKGEKIEKRDQTITDLISVYLSDIEIVLKSWETKDEIDNLLYSLARFMLVYIKDYHLEFENFIVRISKWQDYDENKYPYSEILKIVYGDDEYRRQFRPKRWRNFKDREKYPYPYVFKPPSPPDDLTLAPRTQLRQPPKKKDSKEKISCQYCGLELTKEEQITHSCKKKPNNT